MGAVQAVQAEPYRSRSAGSTRRPHPPPAALAQLGMLAGAVRLSLLARSGGLAGVANPASAELLARSSFELVASPGVGQHRLGAEE